MVKRLLAGQKPRVEDVALELRVSARTLQRRLLDEGITFHNLVEEARREMAHHYLCQLSLELTKPHTCWDTRTPTPSSVRFTSGRHSLSAT